MNGIKTITVSVDYDPEEISKGIKEHLMKKIQQEAAKKIYADNTYTLTLDELDNIKLRAIARTIKLVAREMFNRFFRNN